LIYEINKKTLDKQTKITLPHTSVVAAMFNSNVYEDSLKNLERRT
jgi:ribosome maturation protein Sdo1